MPETPPTLGHRKPRTVKTDESLTPAITTDAPAPVTNAWPILDEDQIKKVKEAVGGKRVWQYSNAGKTFLYTTISAAKWLELEAKWIAAGKDGYTAMQDEDICAASVVWPLVAPAFWGSDQIEGGHPQSLATLIREYSGFTVLLDNGQLVGHDLKTTEIVHEPVADQPLPTQDELEELRKASGTGQLSLLTFQAAGETMKYIIKPIPRNAWVGIQQTQGDSSSLALDAVRFSLVWPPTDLDEIGAGYLARIFEEVLNVSGFNAQPEVVEI